MTVFPAQDSTCYDEAFVALGEPRSHWRSFLDHLYSGGPERPGKLWEQTLHLLRESGAVYSGSTTGSTQRRPWPFDPIPMILHQTDWQRLEVGLIQRHHLFTLLLRDLYGMQRVISEGILPAKLVFGHGGFLFPLWGQPTRKLTLPLYATDLVRLEDGQFQVVSDRTQAPSGHGYVLQNRRLTNRLFPERSTFGPIQPLQPFYRSMRTGLMRLAPHSAQNAHIVLMTPGPANETHYEHTFLAHAMGLTLAQGNDLTVRNGRLCLRTLNGLLPVDVVLRRVDEAWCDPLELREDSLLGVVGMVQAAREGHTAMANPLGSGILENLGLHPFLPALCRFFLGENLLLENPKTLWLGEEASRNHVLESWDNDPFSWAVLPLQPDLALPINGLPHDESLRRRVLENPSKLVARPRIHPSMIPGIDAQGMCQRHLLFRAFLHHDGNTSHVMPGGLARVSPPGDDRHSNTQNSGYPFSPRQGGFTKDVWVMDNRKHPAVTISSRVQSQEFVPRSGASQSGSGKPFLDWALCRTLRRHYSSFKVSPPPSWRKMKSD